MTADNSPQLLLDVQYATDSASLPARNEFFAWVLAALPADGDSHELVIRVVDEAESQSLNARYRGRENPTNVLSFPFESPPGIDLNHLGDLVICAPVVAREALQQHKQPAHHWAHMVIHGVLHLRGYDHLDDLQAGEMEALEKQLLAGFGISDPYQTTDMAV